MKDFYDNSKVGSIIISTYRSGTHFLHDCIVDAIPSNGYGEICNDETINQLKELSTKASMYKVCILNSVSPKIKLCSDQGLLKNWHVIRLTHNDKVKHFISYWFWNLNQPNEKLFDSGTFKHHGTPNKTYLSNLSTPTLIDIEKIIVWLQEQLVVHHLPANVSIDYKDLKNHSTQNIQWNPNSYDNIRLQDLFINHQEVYHLLSNFKTITC